MKIHFYADNYIEPWDYRNVFEVGIGGSETSHVEMAIRLAARGHAVTSYGPLPGDCPDRNRYGVTWRCFKEADLDEDGLWIVYRSPCTNFRHEVAGQKRWLVCQDVFYPTWDSKKVSKFDRIIGLCPRHVFDICSRDKPNASKVVLSGNGVNIERIADIELDRPRRNPKRLIWASSPDRGLKETLDIFERAREQVSDLELHCFYGMDNIDKICGGDRKLMPWKLSWDQYDRARSMPGVTWRGRVGQQQLTREWFQAGIWLYPTWFSETSCISCMEAQACGCIPITNPIWGTAHNVKHGIFIEGEQSDPLVKARYVDALVRVAESPDAQHKLRGEMMCESRHRLSWERIVNQWEAWIGSDFFVPAEEALVCS